MENQQIENKIQEMSTEDLLKEILENTRKTKNYIKWQMYITVAFVVLPLLAALAIIPMVMSNLTGLAGAYGLGQ